MARNPQEVLLEAQQNAEDLVRKFVEDISLSFAWLDETLEKARTYHVNKANETSTEKPTSENSKRKRAKQTLASITSDSDVGSDTVKAELFVKPKSLKPSPEKETRGTRVTRSNRTTKNKLSILEKESECSKIVDVERQVSISSNSVNDNEEPAPCKRSRRTYVKKLKPQSDVDIATTSEDTKTINKELKYVNPLLILSEPKNVEQKSLDSSTLLSQRLQGDEVVGAPREILMAESEVKSRHSALPDSSENLEKSPPVLKSNRISSRISKEMRILNDELLAESKENLKSKSERKSVPSEKLLKITESCENFSKNSEVRKSSRTNVKVSIAERLHDHNKEKDEIPEESIDSLVNEFEEKSKHPAQLLKESSENLVKSPPVKNSRRTYLRVSKATRLLTEDFRKSEIPARSTESLKLEPELKLLHTVKPSTASCVNVANNSPVKKSRRTYVRASKSTRLPIEVQMKDEILAASKESLIIEPENCVNDEKNSPARKLRRTFVRASKPTRLQNDVQRKDEIHAASKESKILELDSVKLLSENCENVVESSPIKKSRPTFVMASKATRNSIHQQQSQETLTASSRENLEANLLDTNMNQDSSAKVDGTFLKEHANLKKNRKTFLKHSNSQVLITEDHKDEFNTSSQDLKINDIETNFFPSINQIQEHPKSYEDPPSNESRLTYVRTRSQRYVTGNEAGATKIVETKNEKSLPQRCPTSPEDKRAREENEKDKLDDMATMLEEQRCCTPETKRFKKEKTLHGQASGTISTFSGFRGFANTSLNSSSSSSGINKFQSRILSNHSSNLKKTSPSETSVLLSKVMASGAAQKALSSSSSGLYQNKFKSRILSKVTQDKEQDVSQTTSSNVSVDFSSSTTLRSMPSPLITGSLNRPTTAGRIVNIQSFLPIKPVKHKPTKEEIQAKKEEDLRIKKEKEESARLRKEELKKAEAEKKRLQREERERRVLEARIAKEKENEMTKELQEKKYKQDEEERRKHEEILKKRKQDLEEKRQKEREELRKKKEIEAEILQKRLEEIRKEEEEKRKRDDEEKRRREENERKKKKELEEKMLKLGAETKMKAEAVKATSVVTKERSDSYEITPGRSELPPQKLEDPDNYDIRDLSYGQESDDEDCPKKAIPTWAKGPFFKTALLRQCYQPPDVDHIFAVLVPSIDLAEVFRSVSLKFNKRTSSAVWGKAPSTHKYYEENSS